VSGRDPFAAAAEAGIHRLSLPTPFAVGRVNCYLIEDDPLTLVDVGPNSGSALEELVEQLGGLGHRLTDLGLILVTHQHMDHSGLVEIVARRSGAEVATIEALVPFMERFEEEAEDEDEFASALMRRHGIPGDVVQALRSVSRAYRAWGAAAKVDRVLRDGDAVELRDRTLHVHYRPGHSPTDTLFLDADRRLLLAGDHLIGHISSNPTIARVPGGPCEPGDRPRSLLIYLDSLAKTRELDLDLVLPGHGDPVTDHRALIDQRFRLHRRRAEKIHRLIAERPRTAYELAQALWGNVAVTQAYLTLSEVLGHTDLLVEEGRIREVESDGVARFEAVPQSEA
jgi:glyoxylase-like metal-dependent hydrolase (beta-lactamase superfamily II)